MDTPWYIPSSWAWVAIGDICNVIAGNGFPKHMQGRQSGDYPFFKVGDISSTWLKGESHLSYAGNYLTHEEAQSIKARPLPRGTTVFAKIGAAIALNRRAILSELSLVDNNVMGVYPNPNGLEHRLLFYFMLTIELMAFSRATTVPSVRKSDVEDIPFPLPPLAEQHRIVAEIEKQFTRLDASVAALKRVQANLKRYRASVLKAACEGKLVPTEAELARAEGRDFEPADILLERILAENGANWEAQEKRRGKYKEPIGPETSNVPELPEGWVWATVGQLSSRIEYGTSTKASSEPSGIPVLRMGNIQDGELDFSDMKYLQGDHPETQKTILGHGDLLFNRTNSAELVGKSAVYKEFHPEASFASYLIRVSFLSDISSDYVCTYINSRHGRAYIARVRNQQVGQANVNGTKLAAMPIPLPPTAEQHRIMAEVERRVSVMNQTEAAVEANLSRAERLRQSILKKAFSGKLVPQDPNDEPASKLLERIRAEREAARESAVGKRKPRVQKPIAKDSTPI